MGRAGELLPLSDGLKDRPKARDKAEMLYIFAEESGVPQRLKETAEELLRWCTRRCFRHWYRLR